MKKDIKTTLTKKEKVLNHLKKHGSITKAQAKSRYGVAKLRGIVYSLVKDGVKVNTVKVAHKRGQAGRPGHKYTLSI